MVTDPLSFAIQVIRGRWFTFFASLIINATSCALYVFAIYSNDIKSSLGYDQQTLNTISFFKVLGASLRNPAGLIYEVTPPWVVLAIGAVTNLFGYLMIYLAITGHLAHPQLWQICLYICIGANSQSFTNAGSAITCVKNFPGNLRIVSGLLRGFVGLSGAIFVQLYLGIYGRDSKSLVLLIAWLPSAIVILFLCVIRIIKVRQPGETAKPFYYILYISIALAIYIMIVSIVQKSVTFSRTAYRISATIAVLLFLLLTLAVVIKEEIKILKKKKDQLLLNPPPPAQAVEVQTTPQPPPSTAPSTVPTATSSSSSAKRTPSSIINIFRSPKRGEDYSIPQALVSIDMIVLFIVVLCVTGGTLTAIDNMGQIGESLGYPSQTISTFVSLISVWNFAGRVAAGFISDILLAKYKLPRPLMLTMVLLLCCVGHLLIAFGVPGTLYIASLIIGLCYGGMVPLVYVILSEVFGLTTFSNILPLASPIGSYILNVRVTGYFYDREAAKQHALLLSSSDKPLTCMGVQCFKFSFLIITAVTIFAALALLVLVWRTWDLYKEEIHARFREGTPNSNRGEEREKKEI